MSWSLVVSILTIPFAPAAAPAACDPPMLQVGSGRAADATPTYYVHELGGIEFASIYEESNGVDGLQTGHPCEGDWGPDGLVF